MTARLHVTDSGGSEEVRALALAAAALAWSGPTADDAEPVRREEPEDDDDPTAHLAQAAPEPGVTKASVVLVANWRAAAAVRSEAVAVAALRRRRRDEEVGTTIVLLLRLLLCIYGGGEQNSFQAGHQQNFCGRENADGGKQNLQNSTLVRHPSGAGPVLHGTYRTVNTHRIHVSAKNSIPREQGRYMYSWEQ